MVAKSTVFGGGHYVEICPGFDISLGIKGGVQCRLYLLASSCNIFGAGTYTLRVPYVELRFQPSDWPTTPNTRP